MKPAWENAVASNSFPVPRTLILSCEGPMVLWEQLPHSCQCLKCAGPVGRLPLQLCPVVGIQLIYSLASSWYGTFGREARGTGCPQLPVPGRALVSKQFFLPWRTWVDLLPVRC